jgi:hypothetical protein
LSDAAMMSKSTKAAKGMPIWARISIHITRDHSTQVYLCTYQINSLWVLWVPVPWGESRSVDDSAGAEAPCFGWWGLAGLKVTPASKAGLPGTPQTRRFLRGPRAARDG